MTWAPLLLADPSPCLRRLVLRELLQRSGDDPEVRELNAQLESDPLVDPLLQRQRKDGAWDAHTVGAVAGMGRLQATALGLARLGFLGFGPEHPAVERAAEFLFSRQRRDGAWPLPRQRSDAEEEGHYTMMPLQTALPLRGLAACGYAADSRCERAYDWLLEQRQEDGAWPTGLAGGTRGYVAGYRKMPHSRWGCRSNTTAALACLVLHRERCRAPETRRALDLLLGRQTRDRHALGYETARLSGAESARGFVTYYARFDVAQVLDLCGRAGATADDERVADLMAFVLDEQGPYGLWEYLARPQVSRWVTFDLLRSLARIDETGDWLSAEPPTPFQGYPRRRPRY